jgi:excinuclease UvrABC nuclease subunit
MDTTLRRLTSTLPSKLQTLLVATPFPIGVVPRETPKRGIYLLTEGGQDVYVGRSNNIRERLASHRQRSGDHYTATFAFRIARRDTGNVKATYATKGSRAELQKDPAFQEAFTRAKERVARMTVRVVGEEDPVQQALLEILAAEHLRTPYNDFDYH